MQPADSAPAAAAPSSTAPARASAASGPARALAKLGLVRDIDLALHLPLRYEDETRLLPLAQALDVAADGEPVQVQGTVQECRVETRGRRQLLVKLQDAHETLLLRFLHFYPSQQKTWGPGRRLRVRGEIRHGFFGPEMVHPAVKVVEADTPLPAALTPVYPTSAQLPQAYLRKAVASGLARAHLAEQLPVGTVPAGLPTLAEALRTLHQPPASAPLPALEDRSHPAWQRLKFDELLAQQLSQQMARDERAHLRAPMLAARPDGLADRLRAALPWALTDAQARVVAEIDADLARTQPMNRLLQGDVGAGKTVVAALAAARAIDAGWQCALMAPTELLAEQHFRKLVQWLQPLGITTAWLTGSRRGKGRQAMLAQVESGEAKLVVGTQAMIQQGVAFARLGLAIVDEQHRFGVAQRLALRNMQGEAPRPGGPGPAPAASVSASASGSEAPRAPAPDPHAPPDAPLEPHLLMMSATPIPRTLAMTYYADLDVSTIDTLPPGRTPIVTKVFADNRRPEVVARIRDEVAAGKQVYWVCPLIEESEGTGGAADPAQAGAPGATGATGSNGRGAGRGQPLDLANVTETHAELSTLLPDAMVGLLHGRMPAAEKAAVMSLFAGGQMAVLVATTVIEVGVDVPNASLMVVEHAERFGLAQLHQLRGRVGRGAVASACVLLYTPPLAAAGKARLRAMAETTDGFEIARRDLAIRGPGEFLGARQSGDALLRFADLAEDDALLRRARAVAPGLLRDHAAAARAHVDRWLGSKAEYLKA